MIKNNPGRTLRALVLAALALIGAAVTVHVTGSGRTHVAADSQWGGAVVAPLDSQWG